LGVELPELSARAQSLVEIGFGPV
jgi:hypothetical protein